MINFFTIPAQVKKITNNPFAPKEQSALSLIGKLAERMPSASFKALTSQIGAMAELDEKNPIGKNIDIAA